MNLYRIFYLLFLILPTGITAQLQSSRAQVNVTIAQVQSITIGQPSVAIQLTQMAQYASGNASAVQINHISVGSTTNYQVSVRAQSEFLSINGTPVIPVNTIIVQTAMGLDLTGTNMPASTATTIVPSVALANTDTVVISNAQPEGARGYNITYAIPASQTEQYLNRLPGTYSTSIIYTLAAQ